jgi:hypothetical protein
MVLTNNSKYYFEAFSKHLPRTRKSSIFHFNAPLRPKISVAVSGFDGGTFTLKKLKFAYLATISREFISVERQRMERRSDIKKAVVYCPFSALAGTSSGDRKTPHG